MKMEDIDDLYLPREAGGTYKGKRYQGDDELDTLAEKIIELLRPEQLPLWQAKDVLTRAKNMLDWEPLKSDGTEA